MKFEALYGGLTILLAIPPMLHSFPFLKIVPLANPPPPEDSYGGYNWLDTWSFDITELLQAMSPSRWFSLLNIRLLPL